jgi:hypothetical protein
LSGVWPPVAGCKPSKDTDEYLSLQRKGEKEADETAAVLAAVVVVAVEREERRGVVAAGAATAAAGQRLPTVASHGCDRRERKREVTISLSLPLS